MIATTETTPTERAYALIDNALADMAGVNIVEANKMSDLLLDLRLLLSEIEGAK